MLSFNLSENSFSETFDKPLAFWVMGSGKMASLVEAECKKHSIPLTMWGDSPADKMPSMLNCVDVLILPSRNEGLPLIAAEALACGANAVGAKVGGIPEVMGEDNTFPHGENFVEQISNRIVYMLNNSVEQPLLPCFLWDETARIENDIYTDYINQSQK